MKQLYTDYMHDTIAPGSIEDRLSDIPMNGLAFNDLKINGFDVISPHVFRGFSKGLLMEMIKGDHDYRAFYEAFIIYYMVPSPISQHINSAQ